MVSGAEPMSKETDAGMRFMDVILTILICSSALAGTEVGAMAAAATVAVVVVLAAAGGAIAAGEV